MSLRVGAKSAIYQINSEKCLKGKGETVRADLARFSSGGAYAIMARVGISRIATSLEPVGGSRPASHIKGSASQTLNCAPRLKVRLMGKVVSLTQGRALRETLPKPRECEECGDPIETARLQVMPKAKRCISCEKLREVKHKRAMAAARDNDIIVIRG